MVEVNDEVMALLGDDYPHIEEKAIVDFINSLDVVSDHVREKTKANQKGRGARFLDAFTGSGVKRQELIDAGVEGGLIFLKDYVVTNEARLSKNEAFLSQIMTGIGLISGKLHDVACETDAIRVSLSALSDRVESMEKSVTRRLDYHDLYNSAMAEMNLGLSVFAKKDAVFLPEQALWMLLTRLKNGDFGRWIESGKDNAKHGKTVKDVVQSLRNDCLRIMSELTERSENDLVDRERLFSLFASKKQLLQDALCLVSGHDSNLMESVILAVNSGAEPELDDDLPFVFSNASIYEELSKSLIPGGKHAAIQ